MSEQRVGPRTKTWDTNGDPDADVNAPNIEQMDPMPELQLFILFPIQFSKPVAILVIYPFLSSILSSLAFTQGDKRKSRTPWPASERKFSQPFASAKQSKTRTLTLL